MNPRLLLVLAALLAFPVAAAATTPQDILLTRDGKPVAFASGTSWAPARPGLAAAVALLEKKVPGSRIATLNDSLQRAAERTLGNTPGVLVALDPQTGEVLAFAGNEDPLQPEIEPDDPRPPGSTFKIVTAAAALESGRYTPESVIPCPRQFAIRGSVIRTFTGEAPDGLSLTDAFARSCNTAFAILGLSVGGERLLATAQAFGLEIVARHGSKKSHVRTPILQTELAYLGAGITNVRLTPATLAAIAATVGNGGSRVLPHFELAGTGGPRTISESNAEGLVSMMEAVVGKGTGLYATVRGGVIAGKTGTVDRQLPSGLEVNDAWFVAIAPSKQPRLAVAAMLPRAGIGGDRAAPLVGRFLSRTRSYWSREAE